MGINFGVNLTTLIGSLGTAGRTMAAAAFNSAANDVKICARIAAAMVKVEKGFGADFTALPQAEKDLYMVRAQTALREVQQIIAGS